jgi:hypothetical protein
VLNGTAANFQAILVKRKYCIMVAELLHGVELQCIGHVSIWEETVDVKQLIIPLVPCGSCREKNIIAVRCVVASGAVQLLLCASL